MPASRDNNVMLSDDSPPPAITIESWPLRDEPVAAILQLVAAFALGVAAAFISASLLVGIASVVALIIALRNLWLAAEFQLNELGVRRTVLGRSRRTSWREIAHYQRGPTAIALLPDHALLLHSLLGGITIPYRNQREQITTVIEHYMSQNKA